MIEYSRPKIASSSSECRHNKINVKNEEILSYVKNLGGKVTNMNFITFIISSTGTNFKDRSIYSPPTLSMTATNQATNHKNKNKY
jgi:hypothetical protein